MNGAAGPGGDDENPAELRRGPVTGLIHGVDIDALEAAVRECPAVADLVSGPPGQVATYLVGRRVNGVRVERQSETVQVCARWGFSAKEIHDQVASATDLLRQGLSLKVIVADVTEGFDTTGRRPHP